MNSFDIAIIGPGHVGATAALAFARRGCSVALIGPTMIRPDGRTVAVMGSAWGTLETLGIATRLDAVIAPLAMMRLVDDTGSLFRRPPSEFRASELGHEQYGWNVETVNLIEALMAEVEATPAITRFAEPASELSATDEAAQITLVSGVRLRASLVVGADGRKSVVRQAAGIATTNWQYPQSALTTIVRHARPHWNISTEFHTRHGPCTTVPLPGNRSSIVWMSAPEEAARLMALDDAALAQAVERQTHSILGRMTIEGPRGLTPMSGLSVERFTAPRMALIGEAAHVFPPIGAQGLNLGIRDVNALVDSIGSDDPGRMDGLAVYEASRRQDVRLRTRAVDALNRSLLSDMLPVDFARGFSLLALDTIGPLRRMVMRQGLDAAARS